MFTRRCCSAVLLSTTLAAPLLGQAQPRYSVTPIGGAGSFPSAINNNGQVVGTYSTSTNERHAFLYSGTGLIDLGTLGGGGSSAAGINDAGLVVGSSVTASGVTHAFLYENGSMTDLGTLGGTTSHAAAINNSGQIAGSAHTADGLFKAFLYAGGTMQSLGTLPGGDSSRAFGINDLGQVVGDSILGPRTFPEFQNHAFRYSDGVMSDLGTFGGAYSIGAAINNRGQVTGYATTLTHPDDTRAFLHECDELKNLGTLAGVGRSAANDINNTGQIVGFSDLPEGNDLFDRAFLYEGGAMIDLNSLIDPSLGWILETGAAINDQQQIAAWGCKGVLCQALLLDLVSPIPEPESYGMLLAGLALLGWNGRQRSVAK